jgi:Flp pilus assembly protein CpaB
MKGVQGLLLSIGLGLTGAVCNWLYLERLAGHEARVSFIAIKADAQINIGDTLREDQLVKIDIPRSAVGNLEQVAPRWTEIKLVAGWPSNRSYRGGELVLQQDIRTPAAKDLNEKIGKGEVALWIPVDMRTFNSSRVNPDDEVSFLLPREASQSPTPIGENPSPPVNSTNEIVGPFRILEIGNRTGRPEVQRAAGTRQMIDSSITIVAKLESGHLDAKAERITEYIRSTKSQGLQVILHPKKKPGEP